MSTEAPLPMSLTDIQNVAQVIWVTDRGNKTSVEGHLGARSIYDFFMGSTRPHLPNPLEGITKIRTKPLLHLEISPDSSYQFSLNSVNEEGEEPRMSLKIETVWGRGRWKLTVEYKTNLSLVTIANGEDTVQYTPSTLGKN